MDKKKLISTYFSIVINAIILVLAFAAWASMFFRGGETLSSNSWGSLKYFTVLSNLYMALVGIPVIVYGAKSLIKKEYLMPSWAKVLYSTGVVSVTITFLVVLCFLAPSSSNFFSMYTGSNFFFHFLLPVLAIIDLALLLPSPKMRFIETLYGLIPVGLYGIFYICNYYLHWVAQVSEEFGTTYDWYNFLGNNSRPLWLMAIAILAISFGISVGIWALNKLGSKIYKE